MADKKKKKIGIHYVSDTRPKGANNATRWTQFIKARWVLAAVGYFDGPTLKSQTVRKTDGGKKKKKKKKHLRNLLRLLATTSHGPSRECSRLRLLYTYINARKKRNATKKEIFCPRNNNFFEYVSVVFILSAPARIENHRISYVVIYFAQDLSLTVTVITNRDKSIKLKMSKKKHYFNESANNSSPFNSHVWRIWHKWQVKLKTFYENK